MSRTRDLSKLINGIAADKIVSGTFADARLSSSSVTQHVDLSSIDSDYIQLRQATADLSNLNASNLTSGTIPNARISSGSVTQHVSAVTNTSGSWTPSASNGGFSSVSGRYHKTGNLCMAFAHGKFSSRTSANDSQFFVNGLPFTARNSGDIQGGGLMSFNRQTVGGEMFAVVKANESRVRMYTAGADTFTSNNTSTEYLYSVAGAVMLTNRNFRQSSNNDANDNFMFQIYYITA